ncbi:hypothetical protein DM01DRAFT_1327357 [Hesseltinella vesiculosa]|uniref:Sodium/calcium exchanger membrane region domain-containing protein n=1 Tax=Hesseltinella vesiculosa TaxID=101127 RepID=A0A1X2G7D4_9FUNG|nr:hypothetical protein DM01DRAFT_1327357 [Hesseltinella vesiculosa]
MALGRASVLLLSSFLFISLLKYCWKSSSVPLVKRDDSFACDNVITQPMDSQCSYALAYCMDATPGLFHYIPFYYCTTSLLRSFTFIILCGWLLFLFGFVGIAASDFFCPNLQTIATMLHLSESLTGVTFLALGNGSPDLFSTFSAMQANLGSLALGELIGAASFIVSVVAGTMCAIKPFRAKKHSFWRDVSFFVLSVVTVLIIVHDGRIHLYEAILLVALYVIYVVFVVGGNYVMKRRSNYLQLIQRARAEYEDTEADMDQLLQGNQDDQDELNDEMELYDEGYETEGTSGMKLRIRTSLFSAMEFQDVVQSLQHLRGQQRRSRPYRQRQQQQPDDQPEQNVPLTSMSRDSASPLSSPPSPSSSSWSLMAPHLQQEWKHQIRSHLFPSLQHWREKSYLNKCTSVISVPAILLLSSTLPVVQPSSIQHIALLDDDTHLHASTSYDDDDDLPVNLPGNTALSNQQRRLEEEEVLERLSSSRGSWCQWLTAVHLITSPLLLHLVLMWQDILPAVLLPVTFVIGAVLSGAFLTTTDRNHQPRLYWMMAFVGFIMAVAWIFIIANEVVSVLRTIGMALSVSEAILGLTVFALGNSLGDFVANVTMARLGYPLMAMSACFGGPLLNILLGIGIGATMVTSRRGEPYEIQMSPTILVSAVSLLIVLLSSMALVPLNGYRMSRKLGYLWISIYLVTMVINLIIELNS